MAEPVGASLLIIGDELLAGEVADTNGPFLAEQLSAQGVRVRELRILPDDIEDISRALAAALQWDRLVILCGGLGPTSDDLTTEAVARVLDRPLERNDEAWDNIVRIFGRRGGKPPAANEKQVMLPAGATVLANRRGTAPGYLAETDAGRFVAVLPGPPRENQPMFRGALAPALSERLPEAPSYETRIFRVFGMAESGVEDRLGDFEAAHPRVRLGYQAHFPEILVKLRYPADRAADVEAASAALHASLRPYLYGEGDPRLPEVLGRALAKRDLKLVTAESCTAGLAAKLLTDAPGSSAWLERGFVTYSNEAKQELLGVSAELLEAHGAVSEPVAEAMLAGALKNARADVGIAITGIAGPDGGTDEKPVGTVCLAWGSAGEISVKTTRFPFDRRLNRICGAWAALGQLYRFVLMQGG